MVITFENIHKHIGQSHILQGVSGCIPQGSVTALVGPNGSGKSTLLSILAGIHHATSGTCSLQGKAYSRYSQKSLAKWIALLPQRNPIPNSLTVSDLVTFGRHPHRPWYRGLRQEDKDIIDWAMQETAVFAYRNRPLTALSGGELQRAWLAMTLSQNTPILMLDEPTSWLDISHQGSLLNIVKRLNEAHKKTIIWVLHDLNQARLFSHFGILLHQGKAVASGEIDQVLTPDLISDVYATKVRAVNLDGQPLLLPEYA